MRRERVYELANKYTSVDRNTSYGNPEDNFQTIATMWTAYWKARPITTEEAALTFTSADVAAFMALVKLARIANNAGKGDSWVDLAGYAACGAEVAHASDPEGDRAVAPDDPYEAYIGHTEGQINRSVRGN